MKLTEEKRSQIIESARDWVGTPWHHNVGQKGVGVDCVRFLLALAQEYNYTLTNIPKHYSRISNGKIEAILDLNFDVKYGTLSPCDILVFKIRGLVNHVGLYVGHDNFIHASYKAKKVVEQPLANSLWQRLLYKVYKIRSE